MKKLKQMISLIMVLCLMCGTMVHAETDTSQGDSLLYESEIEERKAFAKEAGLEEFIDSEGYLMDSFFEGKSDSELRGLGLIIRSMTEEELESYVANLNAGIMPYTVTSYTKVQEGADICGMFAVDGILAFCIEHTISTPAANSPTSTPVLVTNDNLRKVLYYGYNGPADQGYTFVTTSMAASEANNIDSGSSNGKAAYNAMIALPSPPGWFKVWKVETNGGATQDLAYYTTEKGRIDIIKYSEDSELTNDNSAYSLAGAVYGIYLQDGDYSSPEYTVTLEEWSDGWAPTGLAQGVKYGWASVYVAPGNYWVKEITAPSGFKLDDTWYPSYDTPVTVTEGSTVYIHTEDKIQTGALDIIKYSADSDMTNNNLCYSLAGAVYGVYAEDGDYSEPEYTITLEEYSDGWITAGLPEGVKYGWGRIEGIPIGNYWVKEIEPPKGFDLDDTWYPSYSTPIYVGNGTISTVKTTDYPQMDPVGVLLGKVNKETNDNKPVNSLTLEGALYEFKFYGIQLDDPEQDPATLGEEALKNVMQETWVFRTDEDGYTYYDEKYKVSGPNIHKSLTGIPSLPIGTLTIQEIEAPEGYLVNETVYVIQILAEGSGGTIETYNYPIVPEATFDLDVIKIQEGTEVGIPGAVFEHTKPDGTTEILTTDANGCLSFKALNYGDHKLREVSAPEGYIKNENVITYTIATDNSVTFTSQNDNTVSLSVSEEGNVQAIYYEKIYPFSFVIHKQNDKGASLEAAEFVLYSDAECTQVVQSGITGADGIIRIENLTAFTKYYLKETKAPPGYAAMTDEEGNPLVTEIYVSIIPARDEFKLYVNGVEYDFASQGDFSFSGTKEAYVLDMTVINELGYVLPNTGSTTTLLVMLAGVLLFVVGITYMDRKKVRK